MPVEVSTKPEVPTGGVYQLRQVGTGKITYHNDSWLWQISTLHPYNAHQSVGVACTKLLFLRLLASVEHVCFNSNTLGWYLN